VCLELPRADNIDLKPVPSGLFECKSSERGARGVQKAELNEGVDSENNHGGLLNKHTYYIGLDVHKNTISYALKT
jgi:hypothetical protein